MNFESNWKKSKNRFQGLKMSKSSQISVKKVKKKKIFKVLNDGIIVLKLT